MGLTPFSTQYCSPRTQAYEGDWRNFFDCMLAPVVKQAVGVVDKLNLAVSPYNERTSIANENIFAGYASLGVMLLFATGDGSPGFKCQIQNLFYRNQLCYSYLGCRACYLTYGNILFLPNHH